MIRDRTRYVSIWERNRAEERRGVNDRAIDDGFTISPNIIEEYPLANGNKLVKYKILDLSNSTKVIRIATCPNGKDETDVYCPQTITIIYGTAGD